MAKEVTVKISPTGEEVTMDANNFTGASCTDLMKRTIDALGVVTEDRKKAEFYQSEGSNVRVGA